jgi:SAM-dependent methyltransferase
VGGPHRELSGNINDAPIAIFGGGRHTRWLLESLQLHQSGPRLAAIIDDAPRAGHATIGGLPIVPPADIDPSTITAVIVSTDSIEDRLAARAQAWASKAANPPRVIRLYEHLPPGPYDASHDEMFTQLAARLDADLNADLAAAIEENFGPFTAVKRLPAAPPGGREPNAPLPIPPKGRRSGYDNDDAAYLALGKRAAQSVLACVRNAADQDWNPNTPKDILEWGCSSARVLRHMPDLVPGSRCWGCDIDAWSIEWAAANLAPPLRLFRSTLAPHLPFESASFDLVYAISVFTHLSDHWDTWLMELRRILRPGGHFFASINDENVWKMCGESPDHTVTKLCPRLDFSKPMEGDFVAHGRGPHAQSFWHTEGVKRRWSFAFDVLSFTPGAIDGGQTGVVLRKAKL